MYSNNILTFQESTTILNACTKIWKLIEDAMYFLISDECDSETFVEKGLGYS